PEGTEGAKGSEGTAPGLATDLTNALTRNGAEVATVSVPPTADRARFAEVLTAHRTENGEPALQGVLSLLGLSRTPTAVTASVSLVQAVNDVDLGARVWAVTQGAVAALPGAVPHDTGARLWAFGRVASLELPGIWGGLIDLPPGPLSERTLRRTVDVIGATGTPEGEVAIRSAGTYGRRVARFAGVDRRQWRPRGTVLVTGGTGALGGHVSRWLAANGAAHLVLTSRRGMDAPGAAG
ncbi:KR domain-containing protein, partial [Streptomyces chryseus]